MKSKNLSFMGVLLGATLALTTSVGANAANELAHNWGKSGSAPVVGISTGSSGTQWRDEMIASLKKVGNEYKKEGKIKSYRIVNNVTNGDATEQANIIRNFISQGVNIILLDPNSAAALNGVIREAENAGILVVPFDATVTAPNTLQVTVDQYAWEKKWVSWLCHTMQKGNAVEIYGLPGHPANKARVKAAHDVLAKYPKIHLIAKTSGYWDETKAKEAAAQIIASGKRIDGVLTQDSMGYGVLQAFLDAGKLPKVMFADPSTQSFKEWRKLHAQGKDVKFVSESNPPGIGGTAFRIALNVYNGEKFKPNTLTDHDIYYYRNTTLYTEKNFNQGWQKLKGKPDGYLLNHVMTQKEVDALFQ
ncbi:MAG TPA: substrate-binding domain-containing protein [Gammaproteobacteria bacterium]|nr:substrate-binding domain-containing protein [Gammaproteobacteria bacterium]